MAAPAYVKYAGVYPSPPARLAGEIRAKYPLG
jgi:hypothetical protein